MIITDKETTALLQLLNRCIWDGNNPTFTGMPGNDKRILRNMYRRLNIQRYHKVKNDILEEVLKEWNKGGGEK